MAAKRLAIIVVVGQYQFASIALAETQTQIGQYSCTVPQRSAPPTPPPYVCPRVAFSTAFGGTPTVQLTGTADPHLGNGNPAVVDADANGFTYSLDVGGGKIRNFTGRWIAVGPSSPVTPPPEPPPASLSVIKMQAALQDYCISENVNACAGGKFWSVKAICPKLMKTQSVSCSLNNFSYNPSLIENSSTTDESGGICVWSMKKKPDSTTRGAIIVVCGK